MWSDGARAHRAARSERLTLDKIVLSVTLLAPLCLTLTVQAAALGLAQSQAITREHRCCCTISQPTRKRRFAKILQPTRKCRFATLLSCSPHASAGLHPRCPAARTLQPHHIAAHTQMQVRNLVIMLPTHKCGFASVLPCIPHASAG